MKTKPTPDQLEALKSGVQIYAPLCLYFVLKELRFYRANGVPLPTKETDEIAKLYGIPLGQWPKQQKEEWRKLGDSFPLEQTKKIFAEVHYFLIYSIGALTSKYVDAENQALILDFLYSTHGDYHLWNPGDPTEDCFSKYRNSNNTFNTLTYSLGDAIAEQDPLLTRSLAVWIAAIPKFLLSPAVDKIFNEQSGLS